MSENKIRVLVAEPLKPCEVREISGLKAMQDIVGGHIQAVYPFHDNVALVCNEDGKILDLPYNRPLTNDRGIPYDMICGTFFLAGVGAEDFVSLTDEQIQKFSALYDNMMVVTAEIAPDAVLSDYAVSCVLSFRLTHEGQEPSTFTAHITEIFNKDEALAVGAVDSPVFTFHGCCAEAQYTFARQDKDEAGAEAFAEQCVRNVQKQMEQCGCKLEKVECFAEKLEPDVVHTKKQTRGQGPQGKKKGNPHHER